MNIVLADDGTMDTVIRCTDCGTHERFTFAATDEESYESGEEGYDKFVDDCIEQMKDDHECPSRVYEYFINLDERGEFRADVRNEEGRSVYEIAEYGIFEDGFMSDRHDLDGLKKHLVSLGIMEEDCDLIRGN
jgi:hypothetical protein